MKTGHLFLQFDKKLPLILILIFHLINLRGQSVLEVGAGRTYADPQSASRAARPGDTILIYPGTYRGTFWIENLKGTATAWISIRGTDRDRVIFSGGSESLHISDGEYLRISQLTITGQSGNGMNIDDAGTLETPAKHIVLSNLVFRDMAASGNNDMLKLSGLDSFEIWDCSFTNGSAGGSGIDMVGCHAGIIRNCSFVNQGSNCIQAKGGSSGLHISMNFFRNGGQRSLNLGGSTGAAFFRPAGANYEAKDILVTANIFEGSLAPIAFVGCRNVRVINNTIIRPERWVARILQESPDTSFYQSCAYNSFINNLVVVDSRLSTDVNIGPNTLPSSFTFANNLWFHENNASYRPSLPVTESGSITGRNPGFVNDGGVAYGINGSSPAYRKGRVTGLTYQDYLGRTYASTPSMGAMEYALAGGTKTEAVAKDFILFPNPVTDHISVRSRQYPVYAELLSLNGEHIRSVVLKTADESWSVSDLPSGVYLIRFRAEYLNHTEKILIWRE